MLSYEREIEQLRPTLGDERTNALIARERREVFSLHPELRIAAWAGAMLLATAAGIFLKNNLERLGPVALATLIALAALACYAWSWRAAQPASDYVLLLGALLLSADVAFLEQQYELLDRHSLLVVALAHAATAYAYRSRIVLSLAIAALGGWISGEDPRALDFFVTSAIVIVWHQLHLRLDGIREFLRVFEHFAANLALWGGLLLLKAQNTYDLGCAVTLALAILVVVWGRMQRSELFVLYAFVYAVIAVDAFILKRLHDAEAVAFTIFVSMIVAVAVLIRIHRERRT